MKKVFIFIITFYQKVISPLVHQLLGVKSGCRYNKTCSVYAKEAIEQYGVGKGALLSIKRIFSCQPFFSL